MSPCSPRNIHLAKQTGYFDLAADQHPLLHTWLLSLEEQFYLLLPLLLTWLQRRRATSKLAIFSVLWGVTFAWSCHAVARDAGGSYYYLQGRLFEFLSGVLLAALFQAFPVKSGQAGYDLLLLAGLALIVWCGVHHDAGTAMPGMGAFWPCLGATLAIAGIQRARCASMLLANRGSIFIGKVSYGFYLWHWPAMFVLGRLELNTPQWMLAAIGISLALALAVLTHHWVAQGGRSGLSTTRGTVQRP